MMENERRTTIPPQQEAEQCEGIAHAIKRFEKIMMSRIYLQQRLGDRLKVSIRTGMIVMFLIAASILMLLITLSVQVKRVAEVTENMNVNFDKISQNMVTINAYMQSMEKQIAYMPNIEGSTQFINQHMKDIKGSMTGITSQVRDMHQQLTTVQQKMGTISASVSHMNQNVSGMNHEVQRMAKPAHTLNKMFPF